MIANVIAKLTGRTYAIDAGDIGYLVAKGGIPFLRGLMWSLVRLRRPSGLLLGPGIQFVQSGRLRLGRGVAIGGYGYVDCAAQDGLSLGDRFCLALAKRLGVPAYTADRAWKDVATDVGAKVVAIR